MNIFAICAICLLVVSISKVIESSSREMSFLLSATAVTVILLSVSDSIFNVIDGIKNMSEQLGIGRDVLSISVKILGISYICELCSNSCRDAGESALGSIIELSGKIAIGTVCLPIVSSLLNSVVEILE